MVSCDIIMVSCDSCGLLLLLLQYYNECHGIVYVVDSSDPEMLTVSAETFSKL